MPYIVRAEIIEYGAGAAIVAGISTTTQDHACIEASQLADGYLRQQFLLPLTAWGTDLKGAVAKIAAYNLLSIRGFTPDGADQNVRDRYDDAIKWLAAVATGKITPSLTDSSVRDPSHSESASSAWRGVVRRPRSTPRGW
jgi:phage gp36-like protein